MGQDKNTEEKILEAARNVFVRKGLEGARMQEIADEAGINKALLHYYFRSKQKLFEAIFKRILSDIFSSISRVFGGEYSVEDSIRRFTRTYIDAVIRNPYIPEFILHELNKNSNDVLKQFQDIIPDIDPFMVKLLQEMEAGNIRKMDPRQLLLNIISLCVLPSMAKPIASQVIFKGDIQAYDEAIVQRKTVVSEFILNAIKL